MYIFPKVWTAFWRFCCACLMVSFPVRSQASEAQLRMAFQNIRSDDIPYNGCIAAAWLYEHRNEILPELRDELYRTDRQGRDAIFQALMAAKGFEPDARFCEALVARLNDEDHFVSNTDLHGHVHWNALRYIDARYAAFKPLLVKNMQTSNDMWCVWGSASVLDKHGDLAKEEPNFSRHLWEVAAQSLRSDNIPWNAGQAVRFYLMVGKDSLPHLTPLTNSGESQTRDIAAALVDAMAGSRSAYGYLGSILTIDRQALPEFRDGPDWYDGEIEKWLNKKHYRR